MNRNVRVFLNKRRNNISVNKIHSATGFANVAVDARFAVAMCILLNIFVDVCNFTENLGLYRYSLNIYTEFISKPFVFIYSQMQIY